MLKEGFVPLLIAVDFCEEVLEMKGFEDLPLSHDIMLGVMDLGFKDLFPIQAQAILPLLEGRDVIGQARTGTGKTAAFSIPMLERLKRGDNRVQGLVLVPTRELAIQVADHINKFGKYTPLRALPIYGGQPIWKQIKVLQRGVHVVVGTPGRIIDHLKRNTLRLGAVKIVVLDEADRMLDMGFRDDIEFILRKVPSRKQISFFSATIGKEVMELSGRYMLEPKKILVSKDEIAVRQLDQYYMVVNPWSKFEILCDLINEEKIRRAIIFCKTRKGASILANRLKNLGYNADVIHAGFSQAQRDSVIRAFRSRNLELLVATEVAARGLDIDGITHILNYDVPLDPLMYFHRIGRTARTNHSGVAITLVGYGEQEELNRIRALTKTEIKRIE